MGFIEKTESKFGKYAIHGLPQKLATIQVIFFVILMIKQVQGFNVYETLNLVVKYFNIPGTTILSDTVLTLAMPSVLPAPSLMNYLFMYFGTYLFVLYGNSLENLWGAYKFNAYIFTNLIVSLVLSQFVYVLSGQSAQMVFAMSFLNFSVFLAAATHFPKFELLLFFILPVPLWILGILGAGMMIYMGFSNNWLGQLFIYSVAFGAYLLFHLKHFKDYQVQKIKTTKFDNQVKAKAKEGFHKCHVCQKTELDDKDIDFRIGNDGEEYCTEHIKQGL
jgi:hypothetical protein